MPQEQANTLSRPPRTLLTEPKCAHAGHANRQVMWAPNMKSLTSACSWNHDGIAKPLPHRVTLPSEQHQGNAVRAVKHLTEPMPLTPLMGQTDTLVDRVKPPRPTPWTPMDYRRHRNKSVYAIVVYCSNYTYIRAKIKRF